MDCGKRRSNRLHREVSRRKSHQRLGVRMERPAENIFGAPFFDHAPRIHHSDSIDKSSEDGWIMADQYKRRAMLAPDPAHESQNFRLQRSIEFAGGLVGDDQSRVASHGLCNRDPLPLSAAQLMRVRRIDLSGLIEANFGKQFFDASAARLTGCAYMRAKHLGNLIADRNHGIQRQCGILRNECNPRSSYVAQLTVGSLEQIASPKEDCAIHVARIGGKEPQQSGSERALSGSRLTEDAQGFSRPDRQAGLY